MAGFRASGSYFCGLLGASFSLLSIVVCLFAQLAGWSVWRERKKCRVAGKVQGRLAFLVKFCALALLVSVFRVSRFWISWWVGRAGFGAKTVVFLAVFGVRLAFGFLVKMARFWLEKLFLCNNQGCGFAFFASQNLKVKTGLTSRAADKCGRSAALSGSPNKRRIRRLVAFSAKSRTCS